MHVLVVDAWPVLMAMRVLAASPDPCSKPDPCLKRSRVIALPAPEYWWGTNGMMIEGLALSRRDPPPHSYPNGTRPEFRVSQCLPCVGRNTIRHRDHPILFPSMMSGTFLTDAYKTPDPYLLHFWEIWNLDWTHWNLIIQDELYALCDSMLYCKVWELLLQWPTYWRLF